MNTKTELFLKKAKEKFPHFDYSKVSDFNSSERDKVCIICPEHGEFYTSPKTLLHAKYGCPICAEKLRHKRHKKYSIDQIKELPQDLVALPNPIILNKVKLVGTIYCFVNKVNHKLYIGKTVKSDYTERFYTHYYNAFYRNLSNYFYKALRKYTWEQFDKIILYQTEILANTEDNKKLLDKLISEREIFYIKKFQTNSPKHGYNLTTGGDGIVGYKHTLETRKHMSEKRAGSKHWKFGTKNIGGIAILQFDLDFNFVRKFLSMKEASDYYGISANNISRCCSNKLDTYKNSIWVKESDYFDGYLQKYKSRAKCKSNDKEILQFDFDGDFIGKYISASAAAKQFNLKDLQGSIISKAATGKEIQGKGFIWIYVEDFSEKLLQLKIKQAQISKNYKTYMKTKQLAYTTTEFKITGISEGLREEDLCFTLETEDGKPFKAKPMGSRELKQYYRENIDNIVGKMATVKFFYYSADGIPLLPVVKCIRNYE